MDISEIKTKRDELQEAMAKLVQQFERETGVTVIDLTIDRHAAIADDRWITFHFPPTIEVEIGL